MKTVRPYHVLSESLRIRMAESIRKSLRDWSDIWLARETKIRDIVPVDVLSASHWMVSEFNSKPGIGVGYSRPWLDNMARIYAGIESADINTSPDEPSEIVLSLCKATLEALALHIAGEGSRVTRSEFVAPDLMRAPGSGFLAYECRFIHSASTIQIVGWPEWVGLHRGPAPHTGKRPLPLASLTSALERETVRVNAIIGKADLALGELTDLAIGDVLVVDRLIDEALSVEVDGGDIFAGGHLCAVGGKKAIELLSLNP
jgi:Type III flagellar switch regulator (C-ring) FliN C-term